MEVAINSCFFSWNFAKLFAFHYFLNQAVVFYMSYNGSFAVTYRTLVCLTEFLACVCLDASVWDVDGQPTQIWGGSYLFESSSFQESGRIGVFFDGLNFGRRKRKCAILFILSCYLGQPLCWRVCYLWRWFVLNLHSTLKNVAARIVLSVCSLVRNSVAWLLFLWKFAFCCDNLP